MVCILLGEGFEEAEALVPADLLRRAGIETVLVGLNGSVVAGGHGIRVQTDLPLERVELERLEMLVLPGGMGGVNTIRGSQTALALIQRAHDRGIYVAAICAAPTILARQGILDRREAVCYPGMEEEMGSAIVKKGSPVVADGRIITADAAGSAFDFGLKLVEVLRDAKTARTVRESVHYRG